MTTINRTLDDERSLAVPRLVPVDDRSSRFDFDVAVVGLGYVGLPTAIAYHSAGTRVLGLDVSAPRLSKIVAGHADLLPRDQQRLAVALAETDFELTSNVADLSRAASIVVCVPTPVDRYLTPDLRMLAAACASVVEHVVPGQLVMLTSTTYVGCTEDLLVQPLTARGLVVGRDVFVAFSAERIDPGNASFEQEDVPRVLGGATDECEEEADTLLHRYATTVHHVGSLAAAEMTKLLENTFRAVNIALANEFADICAHLGVDVNGVIDAASTKPYGFMAFRPGPGVGGHCIPCDPHYLLWQLRKERVSAPLIERTMQEIASRPRRVAEQARLLLSEKGIALDRARILVVGVSYKPDVADLRESPALEILSHFSTEGASVGFVDDHFDSVALEDGDVVRATRRPEYFHADLVLVHTKHSGVTLDWITDDQIILDTSYPSPTDSTTDETVAA